ncbi:MAG: porin [Gemmatimonadota bacterium]
MRGQDTTRADSSAKPAATAAAPAPKGNAAPIYPLNPTTAFPVRAFAPMPTLSGYISVRGTRRDDITVFQLNRGRLTAVAAPKPFLAIRIQGDLSSAQTAKLRSDSAVSGFSLTDAYVELVAPPAIDTRGSVFEQLHPSLIAGQFKTPFSLEYLTSFALLKTASRSQVVDKLSQKRDIGVQAQVGWGPYATLTLAIVNGEGPNVTANANGTVMYLSRLTLTPLSWLELSGKIERDQTDHAWGFDARAIWRGLTVEGEGIYRKRPTTATVFTDAGGGYALISYKLTKWLEPVYKYDRYYDTRYTYRNPATTTTAAVSDTWNVFGLNILTTPEWLRLQLDYNRRNEKPTPGRSNEYIAQLIAIF